MSEPYDRQDLQGGGAFPRQDETVGDQGPMTEDRLGEGRTFEAEAPEALQTGDGGPDDVPATTDERLAERLDPNRHHAGEPEGLATMLQPGGVIPGGGPGATEGSIGTGGGSTGGEATGDPGREDD